MVAMATDKQPQFYLLKLSLHIRPYKAIIKYTLRVSFSFETNPH
jgi:hypothetical protein